MNNSLILVAAQFAAEMHGGQMRRGAVKEPYIVHPLRVAEIVSEAGFGDEVVAAALLHDVLEDTNAVHADLAMMFGNEIADVVLELTDDPDAEALGIQSRKSAQAEKAAGMSVAAKAVKIADQMDNVRDMGQNPPVGWSAAKRIAYIDSAARVVGSAVFSCNDQRLYILGEIFDRVYVDANSRVVGVVGY